MNTLKLRTFALGSVSGGMLTYAIFCLISVLTPPAATKDAPASPAHNENPPGLSAPPLVRPIAAHPRVLPPLKPTPLRRRVAADSTPASEDRLAQIQVQRTFGAVLDSLGLPADILAKIKALLKDSQLAEKDFRAANPQGSPAEIEASIKKAQVELDKRLQELVDANIYTKITQMVNSSRYLDKLRDGICLDAAFADVPLSGEQILKLSVAMTNSYDPTKHPELMLPRPIDAATGLTSADEDVLINAAAFLLPDQIQLLKQNFIHSNNELAP